ncbi:MAG: nickel-binding protein [Actinomycetota bacterium]
MPHYLDRHNFEGMSPADAARAHVQDLEVQPRYNVRYLTYWFDYDRQTAFCLVDAPSVEAAEAVHREAHRMVAHDIIQIDREEAGLFLGSFPKVPSGEPYVASAFRAILFTDIVGSTELTQRLGDLGAMKIVRRHDDVVGRALRLFDGRRVKHTGDGIMASFIEVPRAVECGMEIQKSLRAAGASDLEVHLRVGLAAGEPVTENEDLFGTAVQLASRLCGAANPDGILVSSDVFELSAGGAIPFSDPRELMLKGFGAPVRAYAVLWDTASP